MWQTMDEEVQHRRLLLRLAAKGNAQARKELDQEYHAQVYPPDQVAKYVPKAGQPVLSAQVQRALDTLVDVKLGAGQ
jgi:hypothetical protein